MSTDLYRTFETILVDTFGVEADQVDRDVTFEALGLDSLDVVELTLVVEQETGIKLEDEELEDIRTVGDAIDKVAGRQRVSA
jgi:acyl carrier protein